MIVCMVWVINVYVDKVFALFFVFLFLVFFFVLTALLDVSAYLFGHLLFRVSYN